MLFPAGILPWIEARFFKLDAITAEVVPNADGLLYSYIAGTNTPQYLYSDVNLTLPWANPVILDANGMAPGPLYMLPNGYRFIVADENNVQLYAVDNIEDVGQVFASTFGTVQAGGSKNVVSGYIVLPTDRLVTVSSTGGPNPCVIQLPAASSFTNYLTIKNVGSVALAVTPFGLDTLEALISTAYTVPAASSPSLPAIDLVSDGVSAWYIVASHKVP